jgi:hypothetical protein
MRVNVFRKKIMFAGISVILGTMTFLFNSTVAFAQTGSAIPRIPNPSQYNSLEDIVNVLTGLIRPVFLVTFAAMTLYGAGVYLTAKDDDNQIAKAKKIFWSAIIGFGIAVFAPSITNIIASFVGVDVLNIQSI